MNDAERIELAARRRLAEAIVQYGFVKANWGKLSMIVITAFVLGAFVGAVLL